jgi:hypothetical protein
MSNINRDNRTVHGKFRFGFKTKHRFPTTSKDGQELIDMVNLLYPTGRVWLLPEKGSFRSIHDVINNSIIKVKDFCNEMIDSYFPDNDNFTEEDCDFWENKLGLITSNSLSLEKRKEIILRKIAFPQNIKARQGLDYIQSQIDLYGFDVKIYENIFIDENGNYYHANPVDVIGEASLTTQHGFPTQHGQSTQHGNGSFDIIANNIRDEVYSIGGNQNLWATFFIASKDSLYMGATVPNERKKEFKELILKLKPAHLIAFCLINYQ